MRVRMIFEGEIDDHDFGGSQAHIVKVMEACFHLMWGYAVNVDPSQCTFIDLDDPD